MPKSSPTHCLSLTFRVPAHRICYLQPRHDSIPRVHFLSSPFRVCCTHPARNKIALVSPLLRRTVPGRLTRCTSPGSFGSWPAPNFNSQNAGEPDAWQPQVHGVASEQPQVHLQLRHSQLGEFDVTVVLEILLTGLQSRCRKARHAAGS